MIANFFQSLDRNGGEYLLISGQATVLYGAATFSELRGAGKLMPEGGNVSAMI